MRHTLITLALVGCSDPESDRLDSLPDAYAFASRDGSSDSVAYDGQVFRHLLIGDMKTHIGRLTERIDSGWVPQPGDVAAELELYLAFDGDIAGELPHLYASDPAPMQTTYNDVSSGKDLLGKLAGNDEIGQHVDWATDFRGWAGDGGDSPEALVRHWIASLDAQAVARASGDLPPFPDGSPAGPVYVTPDGLDLAQLLEKFLRGAIAYSQSADDYLDDDVDGKGLLSDHSALEEGEPFTALEHQWDEGFGYFGASRTYGSWSLEEIASPGAVDVDGDGTIDLLSEVVWGHAGNTAKRDLGAVAPTDFTQQAWEGFARGRQLLANTSGPLTESELDLLISHRDAALGAWERAIASTALHYINRTLQDMRALGTDDYSAVDHAKHWAELKGFALSLQFSPHSALSKQSFDTLHDHLGDAPVMTAEGVDAGVADLLAARELLAVTYDFDPTNLGDDDGVGGW